MPTYTPTKASGSYSRQPLLSSPMDINPTPDNNKA